MKDTDTQKLILVVDDNKSICLAIQDLLESEGYRVDCIHDGKACLDFVTKITPDLIILDVLMPDVSGIEVCRQLKENLKTMSVPVIFVTGQYDYESRILCKKAGGDEFLNKPVDATELLIRTKNLLRLKHYHDLILRDRDQLEQKVFERTTELRKTHEEMLVRLSMAAEYKDGITGAHLTRISRFSELTAREHGIDEARVQMIRIGAICHDIGKIGVPESILEKPGPLTDDEWLVMREHPKIGARILSNSNSDLIRIAESIAHYHHENWDGSGYPHGLKEDSIPLSARIVRVVDVFDALISKRPYKKAFSVEESLTIIEEDNGRFFDPAVAESFFNVVDKIEPIINNSNDVYIHDSGSTHYDRIRLYG
ncbi:response regulator, partial [bacterium]|nr:response regulator [bacterium]